MKLKNVTITGPDDRTDIGELAQIALESPWVEWGILLWNKVKVCPKFPSEAWLDRLKEVAFPTMNLSAHLCGGWARSICRGEFPQQSNRKMFGRMQLNIAHSLDKIRDVAAVASCLPAGREYLVQVGCDLSLGIGLAEQLAQHSVRTSVLFDQSSGRGICPSAWPKPVPGFSCGYAGGLGPENLSDELKRIEDVAGDAEIWIDMQSSVRSENNTLDLNKVRRVLEITAAYAVTEAA